MKKIYIPALLLLALAAASCGNPSEKGKTAAGAVSTTLPAAKISVYTAGRQTVPQTETYSSTVKAWAVNNIAPQTGSRIQKINVDVGSFVGAGQVLAEMDRIQLDQQKLQLANLETELGRLRQLYQEGGVSQSDFEAAELQYNVAKSTVKNLEENTILRSPIGGVVSARNYDRGDMYTMGQPIFTVQQITPVKLLVGVSEADYTKVQKGQTASISADALPGRTFSGTVNRIYPTMDAASHTFNVEIKVDNSDRALRPGMYAKVTLSFGDNLSVVVPDEAVVKQMGSGQRFVFTVQPDSTVRSNAVTLGRHFGTSYEILSGVSEGETVAVEGASALKDGAKVQIVERQ
jgi:RND family efflux transporter MFP subunit